MLQPVTREDIERFEAWMEAEANSDNHQAYEASLTAFKEAEPAFTSFLESIYDPTEHTRRPGRVEPGTYRSSRLFGALYYWKILELRERATNKS